MGLRSINHFNLTLSPFVILPPPVDFWLLTSGGGFYDFSLSYFWPRVSLIWLLFWGQIMYWSSLIVWFKKLYKDLKAGMSENCSVIYVLIKVPNLVIFLTLDHDVVVYISLPLYTFLNFSSYFLICKLGLIIVFNRSIIRVKGGNACKVLNTVPGTW